MHTATASLSNVSYIGVLVGRFGRKIDGDPCFTWWFHHLPGKPIYFPGENQQKGKQTKEQTNNNQKTQRLWKQLRFSAADHAQLGSGASPGPRDRRSAGRRPEDQRLPGAPRTPEAACWPFGKASLFWAPSDSSGSTEFLFLLFFFFLRLVVVSFQENPQVEL